MTKATVFSTTHARRLMKLAAAIQVSETYTQGRFNINCNTPGCLIGHAVTFPEVRKYCRFKYPLNVWNDAVKFWDGPGSKAARYYGLTTAEADAFFSSPGCDNACEDRVKAAAYVYAFVANKLLTIAGAERKQ